MMEIVWDTRRQKKLESRENILNFSSNGFSSMENKNKCQNNLEKFSKNLEDG